MIDFHSHILPGFDDDSRSVAESIAMLRLFAERVIGEVILPPTCIPSIPRWSDFWKTPTCIGEIAGAD